MTGEKLSLEYLVRPPSVETKRPPLLILLHGVGSNERDLFELATYLDDRFLLVSARGPITLMPGSYAWFHVRFTGGRPVINPDDAEASRLTIIEFARHVSNTHGADESRIYLMGFSQGAIMGQSIMLTQPELLAGVAACSGRILPEVKPLVAEPARLAGFPILVQHGLHDQILSIEYGRASRDYLSTLPVDLTYREYEMGHQVGPESLADLQAWFKSRLDGPSWRP